MSVTLVKRDKPQETEAFRRMTQAIYYVPNIKGGSNTVTVTFNQPAVSVDVRIMEYSGVTTSSPLDVTAVG
jgi:hypothetical protein